MHAGQGSGWEGGAGMVAVVVEAAVLLETHVLKTAAWNTAASEAADVTVVGFAGTVWLATMACRYDVLSWPAGRI